jgi:hypothetical protein
MFNIFDNPYREGYSRFPTEEGCYYIENEKMKEILLKELNDAKV